MVLNQLEEIREFASLLPPSACIANSYFEYDEDRGWQRYTRGESSYE